MKVVVSESDSKDNSQHTLSVIWNASTERSVAALFEERFHEGH